MHVATIDVRAFQLTPPHTIEDVGTITCLCPDINVESANDQEKRIVKI